MQRSKIELEALPERESGRVDWGRALEDHEAELRNLVRKRLAGSGEGAVDDVLQEVAIAAHSQGGLKVSLGSEKAWLRQVAINKVKDYWRRTERRGALDQKYRSEKGASAPEVESPYEWVLALETSKVVEGALAQIGEEERDALVQKYLQGRSCRDIAEGEGLPEKAIEYRLKKARETMRTILTKLI